VVAKVDEHALKMNVAMEIRLWRMFDVTTFGTCSFGPGIQADSRTSTFFIPMSSDLQVVESFESRCSETELVSLLVASIRCSHYVNMHLKAIARCSWSGDCFDLLDQLFMGRLSRI
jgi:hypothetical protein